MQKIVHTKWCAARQINDEKVEQCHRAEKKCKACASRLQVFRSPAFIDRSLKFRAFNKKREQTCRRGRLRNLAKREKFTDEFAECKTEKGRKKYRKMIRKIIF